jgi:hypothetical protein
MGAYKISGNHIETHEHRVNIIFSNTKKENITFSVNMAFED